MITKYVKKVYVIKIIALKDIPKNAENSKAVQDVGLRKVVPTNTQRKITQQTKKKLTKLWKIFNQT